MIDVARKLDKAERESLLRAAHFLKKMEQYAYASEIYTKIGDQKMLVQLHVEARHWEDVSSPHRTSHASHIAHLKLLSLFYFDCKQAVNISFNCVFFFAFFPSGVCVGGQEQGVS